MHFIFGSGHGCLFCFFALSRAECGAMQAHVIQRGLTATHMLQIKYLREMGDALANPRAGREKSRMSELMRSCQTCQLGVGTRERGEQERATLHGSSVWIGELGRLRLLAERSKPFGNEGGRLLRRIRVSRCCRI